MFCLVEKYKQSFIYKAGSRKEKGSATLFMSLICFVLVSLTLLLVAHISWLNEKTAMQNTADLAAIQVAVRVQQGHTPQNACKEIRQQITAKYPYWQVECGVWQEESQIHIKANNWQKNFWKQLTAQAKAAPENQLESQFNVP